MEGNDDSMIMFYIGLTSWKVFEHVHSFIAPHIQQKKLNRSKTMPKHELLLVLCIFI